MPEDKIMRKSGKVLFAVTITIFLSMLVVIAFGLPKLLLALLAVVGLYGYIKGKGIAIKPRKEIK